jgi:hypothetical protein
MAQSENGAFGLGDYVVHSVVTVNRPKGRIGVRAHDNQICPKLLGRAKNLFNNLPGLHHYRSGGPQWRLIGYEAPEFEGCPSDEPFRCTVSMHVARQDVQQCDFGFIELAEFHRELSSFLIPG